MSTISKEKADTIVSAQFRRYCELGERGRVLKGTLAAAIGISRSRWSQLTKEPDPNIRVPTFLSLMEGISIMERGFKEGWLPATSARGEPQDDIARKLGVEDPPEDDE